jgi:putative flippase GtrA
VWHTRLYERFRDRIHEMGKFGIVGSVAYLVDTALFVGLVLVMESLTAKTLATLVAATVAFFGNRFWTWRHRHRSGIAREYMLYFTFNGIGLVIALAFLGLSHYGLGQVWPFFETPLADVIAANVIGLGAGTTFRFWSYRRFVFREVAPAPAGATVAAPAATAELDSPGFSPTRPGSPARQSGVA